MTEKGPFQRLIEKPPDLQALRRERVELIREIQRLRGRPLIVYATNPASLRFGVPALIHRDDIIPLVEVLDSVEGKQLDLLIETPGGLAEVTIEIVNLLRPRFDQVAFIVPHVALSAGTILVMSGDEILMDYRSALGPIDPQFQGPDGQVRPAQAILDGIERISKETKEKGGLDPVYIPILRNVDPGLFQSAHNASELSSKLVTDWLAKFKFRSWQTRRSTGAPVTQEDREKRGREIAERLCSHKTWLSHGYPIKIRDLRDLRLEITDYGETPALQKVIWELWVNLHHMMQSTNIYKVYESEKADILKIAVSAPRQMGAWPLPGAEPTAGVGKGVAEVRCPKCGTPHQLQANFGISQPPDPGLELFPRDCKLTCRGCGSLINLEPVKLRIEAQMGQPMVF